MMGTYGPPPLTLVRGRGAHVWDSEGREYVDLVAGIAVCSLGHAHPRLVEAVTHQLRTLGHVSNLYATTPALVLAERLATLTGHETKSFFGNSGTEAVEAALKVARKATGRPRFVAAEGGFHGRTFGALSVTGQPAKRAPFEPLPGPVTFVPYGDTAALQAAMADDVAAVILEPIQGENGVVPPPPGYLAAARRAAHDSGALLILDEVQTGIARTGAWFAWQHEGVVPDVMTLAKGLGGGIPIGACVAFGNAADVLTPGDHGSTFGGNPVACAAALTVLDVIEEDGLLQRAKELGERLARATGARGMGLLRGIVTTDAKATEKSLRDKGFLTNAIGDGVLRVTPPLVIDESDLDAFVCAFAQGG
jgi:acetylornithine aminotransferase